MDMPIFIINNFGFRVSTEGEILCGMVGIGILHKKALLPYYGGKAFLFLKKAPSLKSPSALRQQKSPETGDGIKADSGNLAMGYSAFSEISATDLVSSVRHTSLT